MASHSNINYSSDESVLRLISGCPSLEQLNISRDVFDGVRTFTIDSPTLKSLDYYFFSSKGLIEHDFKLELSAPALSYLYLNDLTSRDFSVLNLCSLDYAEIHVSSPKAADIDSHCQRVVQLIQIVHNVSHLWISGDTLEERCTPGSL
ncbi:hypothetical protein LIER_34308 [Lithospermum erythrorhizon]|uniref:Uncharacterized protein n=1 Tax=Lithospermum erythrorhizon TaxID=34254 RepID=A0AAV3S232_LITER